MVFGPREESLEETFKQACLSQRKEAINPLQSFLITEPQKTILQYSPYPKDTWIPAKLNPMTREGPDQAESKESLEITICETLWDPNSRLQLASDKDRGRASSRELAWRQAGAGGLPCWTPEKKITQHATQTGLRHAWPSSHVCNKTYEHIRNYGSTKQKQTMRKKKPHRMSTQPEVTNHRRGGHLHSYTRSSRTERCLLCPGDWVHDPLWSPYVSVNVLAPELNRSRHCHQSGPSFR